MIRICSFSLLILLSSVAAAAEPVDLDAAYKQGVNSYNAGDIVGAMAPLKSAAEGGHAAAAALYGSLLDSADNDVEAMSYYRMSAEKGNPDGMHGLAGLYLTGDGGEKSPAKALALLQKAAAIEHTESIFLLATGYAADNFALGEASKNSADAWGWYRKAAALDHLDAMARLEAAYRTGNAYVPVDLNAANALQARIMKLQGIDPNAKKKRKPRL